MLTCTMFLRSDLSSNGDELSIPREEEFRNAENIDYDITNTLTRIWQSKIANFSTGHHLVTINGDTSVSFNFSILDIYTCAVNVSVNLGNWSESPSTYNLIEVNDFDDDNYDEVAVYNKSVLWVFDENGTEIILKSRLEMPIVLSKLTLLWDFSHTLCIVMITVATICKRQQINGVSDPSM